MEQEHNSREMRRMDREDDSDEEVDNIEELDNVVNNNDVKIPSWREQITIRGAVASVAIGVVYSVLSMKMNLSTGLVPNLNVSAAFISFVGMRSWTKLLEKTNMLKTPFTKQENQIINTAGTACYTMTYGGELAGGDAKGNSANAYAGHFLIRRINVNQCADVDVDILVIDYKLPYPTGTATAVLINACFGAGMICPHLVNLSLLFGAVLSWGLMWPLIKERKGDWFPANVFVPIALILGDGLYNLLKTVICSVKSFQAAAKLRRRSKTHPDADDNKHLSEENRNKVFMQESIPMWISFTGYIVLSIISIIVIPVMFPQLKWYYVLLAYIIAPPLSFCNAYGAGLTDMNMGYNYGKAAIFVCFRWSGGLT
ncbi:hypothetical protein Leryth_007099 [Lithospermum erythrorhizon]|nr:hypothetical protein Leryth_007099 [Lithospermum erythrorhizon]